MFEANRRVVVGSAAAKLGPKTGSGMMPAELEEILDELPMTPKELAGI
jgi:hypothetical protein